MKNIGEKTLQSIELQNDTTKQNLEKSKDFKMEK